jgi:large subunit ribosomal protein L7/L12
VLNMSDEDKKEQKEKPEAKEDSEKPEDKQESKAKEEASDEAKEPAEKPVEPSEQPQAQPKQKEDAKEAPSAPQPKQEEKPAEKPKKEVKVSGKLADIIKEIEELTVLELAELVKALEDKFGVTAAAPVAVAGGAPTAEGGSEGAPEEGQTTFNVVLADSGANKISVIKAVRELVPTLGLKEAKDLVDAAPKQVLEGVGKDAANEAKQKLEAAGGKVELK